MKKNTAIAVAIVALCYFATGAFAAFTEGKEMIKRIDPTAKIEAALSASGSVSPTASQDAGVSRQ